MTETTNTADVPPRLLDFHQERIRVLHFTWIAFFMTFYVWFNLAPLSSTIRENSDWLTKEHVKVLLIANVALTIPARIVVGALIDRFGARVVFTWLMITMSIPAIVFAFSNTFTQMLISRLVLSSVGAGFVIGIKMVAQWFPPKYIGRTEGFYAGWGNFGSAWAAMTLPWIAITLFDDWFGIGGENAWRYAMALNGLVMGIYGVMYYFLVRDVPDGRQLTKTKKAEPMLLSSYWDLVQYLFWSIPLVGALGLLAWRISNVEVDGDVVLGDTGLWVIYGVLTLVYVGHVVRTLQINLPYLKAGVPENEKYHFGSVVALNSTYFANFGAELAVVSMLPEFYETVFEPLVDGQGQADRHRHGCRFRGRLVRLRQPGRQALGWLPLGQACQPQAHDADLHLRDRGRVHPDGLHRQVDRRASIEDGLKNLAPMFGGVTWLVIAVMMTDLRLDVRAGSRGGHVRHHPDGQQEDDRPGRRHGGRLRQRRRRRVPGDLLAGRRQDVLLHPGRRRAGQLPADLVAARRTEGCLRSRVRRRARARRPAGRRRLN